MKTYLNRHSLTNILFAGAVVLGASFLSDAQAGGRPDSGFWRGHGPCHGCDPYRHWVHDLRKYHLYDAIRTFCPAGSLHDRLDLNGVELVREEGIPLMYEGANNIEGPVWHEGALYYSNIGSRPSDEDGSMLKSMATLWRWVPGSAPEVWLDDSVAGTNGLAVDFNGQLVAARHLDGSISRIDWDTGIVATVADTWEDKRFNSPNDLAIAHDGTIYFTDPDWEIPSNVDRETVQGGGAIGTTEPGQRVYRVDSAGTVRVLAVTELVPELRDKPNGILLSLDERRLYVGGLKGLWVFDLKHGQVSQPRQLLNSAVDGVTKDCTGNIYVATNRAAPGGNREQAVVVLDARDREVGSLIVPGIQYATNLAFGGDDGKTLFVTGLTYPTNGAGEPSQCGDSTCLPAGIYTAHLNVRGFPY